MEYEGKSKNIQVSDKDAIMFVFTCDISGMKLKYEYVYLFAGNMVYTVTFGDLDSTFDTLTEDYEQILNNISFN